MKVGDYVRTPFGITRIKENVCLLDEFIKSSPNIIDLIEVGDYVNGLKVANIENNIITMVGLLMRLGQDDIKSIVTKEQFESMEYRIGE